MNQEQEKFMDLHFITIGKLVYARSCTQEEANPTSRGKIILIETGTHEVDIKIDPRDGKVSVVSV